MTTTSKVVMELLYDAVKYSENELLDNEIHKLIDQARHQLTSELKDHLYEQRLLAETMISRPIMKNFKAKIKAEGLFNYPTIAELEFSD